MGKRLATALFSKDIQRVYDRSLGIVSGKPLRLFFYPEEGAPPVVSMIPWECVFEKVLQDEEHFGLSQFVSVARYVPMSHDMQPLKVEGKLRILAAAPNPYKSQTPLDVKRELELLGDIADKRRDAVEFFSIPDAQWGTFQDELLDKKPHVLIFTGHGDIKNKEPRLLFQTADAKSDPVSITKLESLLKPEVVSNLRVVILSACRTGVSASEDPFDSAAGRLIRMGVPAVVAMQSKVADAAAKEFCLRFFNYLLRPQNPVDVCVNAGRLAMFGAEWGASNRRGTQWAIPVLYLSTRTEMIFDFSSSSAINTEVEKRRPLQKGNFKSRTKQFVERPALVRRLEADFGGGGVTLIQGQYGAGKTQIISAFCNSLIDAQTAENATPPIFLYVECRAEWTTFDDVLTKLDGQAESLGFKGFQALLGERHNSLEESVKREGLDLRGLKDILGRSRAEDDEQSIEGFVRLLSLTRFVIVFDDYIWDGLKFWNTLFARMSESAHGSKVYVVTSTNEHVGAVDGYAEIRVGGFEPAEAEAFFRAEGSFDEATLAEMMSRAAKENYLPWFVKLIREVFAAGGELDSADGVDDYAEKFVQRLDEEMGGAPSRLLKQLSVLREPVSLRGLASMLDRHDPSQYLKAAYALRRSFLSLTRELKVEMATRMRQYYLDKMSPEEWEHYNFQAADFFSRRAEGDSPTQKSPDGI
ncbi:MAG: CHAT domain-containing protein [Pyrinomonadaceae bacterium]